MGIKNLLKFIRENSPNGYGKIVLEDLPKTLGRKCKMAIDANNYIFLTYAIAHKNTVQKTDLRVSQIDVTLRRKTWFNNVYRFIRDMKNIDIEPIFIFDGKYPVEKDLTKEKRIKAKLKNEEKTLQAIADMKSDIQSRSKMIEAQKRMAVDFKMSEEDIEIFKEFIFKMGIPLIQATTEAEKLCSMLCLEGKVDLVYSADSDTLTYGCPLLVNDFHSVLLEDGQRQIMCNSYWLDEILEDIGLSMAEFVDFCIMCGCDYNTNIPLVGVQKSYQIIKKNSSIDEYAKLNPNRDISVLCHSVCRNIFQKMSSDDLIEEGDIDSKEQSPDFESFLYEVTH